MINYFKKIYIPINDIDSASSAIRLAYQLLFFNVALLILFLGISSDIDEHELLSNIVILLVIGYGLYSKNSRLAGICLFLYAIGSTVVTILTRFYSYEGGTGSTNIVVHLLYLYVAYRGMVGTFKYHVFCKSVLDVKSLIRLILIIVSYQLFWTVIWLLIVALNSDSSDLPKDNDVLIWLGAILIIPVLSALDLLPYTKNSITYKLNSINNDTPANN